MSEKTSTGGRRGGPAARGSAKAGPSEAGAGAPDTAAAGAGAPRETASGSAALFERARACIPGGVNSPVRAFAAVGGTPPFVRRASGAFVEDEDGSERVDFVGSWGPLILGHAHPEIVQAVAEAAARGMTYGAPCRGEVELAERVVAAYPGLEQVRFVSSGTEATMSAIRLARGFTGRDIAVKFSGCYHGHADHLLVAAGSGLATLGTASSAGVPEAFASLTRVLPLDEEERVRELFRRDGDRIAAVIVEPIPANHGLLLQRRDFLQTLRDETRRAGAVLIFDEVISGFRVARGGAAEIMGILPDLATFGKILGGGLPAGAFGGTREILSRLAPQGPVYQAGTLSGNPLAMAAGARTLEILEREEAWTKLEALGKALEERLGPVLARAPFPATLVRVGSIFWLCLQDGPPPRSAEAVDPKAAARYRGVFHGLLRRGVQLAPSAYEVGFLSLAHASEHLDRFAAALEEALAEAAGDAARREVREAGEARK